MLNAALRRIHPGLPTTAAAQALTVNERDDVALARRVRERHASLARAVTGRHIRSGAQSIRSGAALLADRGYTCAVDQELRSLIHQKLDAIARYEDSALIGSLGVSWKGVGPAPHCPWVGDLMRTVQHQCHQSVVTRGVRVTHTLEETLKAIKPPYEKNLAADLKAIVDPFFPEDLCLAPAITTRGVYERHNPQKFDERMYEHELALVRVGVANASRDAKQKAHFVIDEYVLAMKNQKSGGWWDSVQLKPGFFGIGVDLKKLFNRNKTPNE